MSKPLFLILLMVAFGISIQVYLYNKISTPYLQKAVYFCGSIDNTWKVFGDVKVLELVYCLDGTTAAFNNVKNNKGINSE